MIGQNVKKRTFINTQAAQVALFLPLMALTAAAQNSASRPPGVPTNYVITPFGYFHPSCVRHVDEGNIILQDGRLQHPDGSIDTVAPVCDFPQYSPLGVLVSGDTTGGKNRPTTNGWVESVSATTSSAYGKISATFKTPPVPASNGQTLFFFPGFEDISHVVSIVQPVLQYGGSAAGGGNYWAIASWNCCISGITDYSNVIKVSPGNTILGTITSNCASGSSACSTWNVVTENQANGNKTSLSKTPSDGQVWNWAFGGVMEVYNVTKCTQYPANTGVAFTVKLYNDSFGLISSPAWTKNAASGSISPKCSFGLSSTATVETVKYKP